MMRRSRPRRGFRRGRPDRPRWTAAVLQSNPLAAGAISSQLLLSPAQLTSAAGLTQLLRTERIVGRLIVRPLGNVGGSVGVGIIETANTGAVVGGFNDPLVPAELGSRDWMWTQNMSWNGNSFANGHTFIRDFDIRTRRRIETEEGLRVIWSNVAGGDAIVIEIDARILITIRI